MSSKLQQMKFYVSVEEKQQIQKAAYSAGLSVSQYISRILTNKKINTNALDRQTLARNTCKLMNLVKKYVTAENALKEFKKLEEERWQLLK